MLEGKKNEEKHYQDQMLSCMNAWQTKIKEMTNSSEHRQEIGQEIGEG